jgi:hypothetical protein
MLFKTPYLPNLSDCFYIHIHEPAHFLRVCRHTQIENNQSEKIYNLIILEYIEKINQIKAKLKTGC